MTKSNNQSKKKGEVLRETFGTHKFSKPVKKMMKETDEELMTSKIAKEKMNQKNRPKAGELFGYLKGWKKPTQELKEEMRKGWLSDSDRKREEEWKKRT